MVRDAAAVEWAERSVEWICQVEPEAGRLGGDGSGGG